MACDSVSRKIWLLKLTYYGITGKSKLLFGSYLRDRYQRFQVTNSNLNQNIFSKSAKVKHGVPQGSILGPLLLLLYISDLPKVLGSKAIPILFVDDTSILITSPNTTELQIDINIVFKQINI
jgi:Reverse transcriptase (RNA-dependent DNA polymerase).